MIVYFAIYLLIIIIAAAPTGSKVHYIAFVPLFIILAFKGQVGCDWTGYLNHYLTYNPNSTIISLRGEVGWYMIETIVYNWELSYQWYYIFTAIIAVTFLALTRKHTGDLGFLVLIYPVVFIQLGLSGVRQFIAVCIATYILSRYFFNPPKSIKPYVLFTLLAATFHVSSFLLFFFLPFIVKLRPGVVFTLLLLSLIAFASNFAGEVYDTMEFRYLTRTRESSGAWIRFMLTAIIVFLAVFTSKNPYVRLGLALIALGLTIGLFNSIALHRMNYFFVPIAALLILKNAQTSPKAKLSLKLSYLLTVSYMVFWFTFSTHSDCLIPYTFFFSMFF